MKKSKSDHNLIAAKLNASGTGMQKMKPTSSSVIFKTIYYNGSESLLFKKRKLQRFENSYELFY